LTITKQTFSTAIDKSGGFSGMGRSVRRAARLHYSTL
jgi:hypothetical protein